MASLPIIAADIGNTSIALGRFEVEAQQGEASALPQPDSTLSLISLSEEQRHLQEWLPKGPAHWLVASVNRPGFATLVDWLQANRSDDTVCQILHDEIPLPIDVEAPERVGIDRLCAATAANRLRGTGRPCIVVDSGTAITLDAISAEGVFLGGAILPGYRLAAESLARGTDALSVVARSNELPPAIGRCTEAAIQSGLHRGTIGAINALISQISQPWGTEFEVVVTGGDGAWIVSQMEVAATYVPHLVLGGILLSTCGD